MQRIKHASKILVIILICGFIVRLHGFNNPIADWHSWRQADTSAVSRNFVQEGYDIFHPRFDDLSNVPSGLNNPEGYRFVEFPLYNLAQAGLFDVIGIFTIEQWGRLVSIIASLFGSYFLYKLVSKYSGTTAGLATAFFYTFLPYNIYYSRTILPDPSMVAMILGGIHFFDKWLTDKKQRLLFLIISLLLTSCAMLIKPYALFYAPVFLALCYMKFGFTLFKQWKLYVFGLLSILPLIVWREWMQQYPEGIPANTWLLNGNGIRFRPAFFRWLGYERLTRLIAGYFGLLFIGTGIIQLLRDEKEKLLYGGFILGAILYLTIFATGNVQHDYYQIVIMPVVAVLMGLGVKFFLQLSFATYATRLAIIAVISLGGLLYSWQLVKDYFNINNWSIVRAGEAVQKHTPKDAKIMAIYNGDTSFLYQTNRKGWASFQHSLPEMVKLGADYLVFASPTPEILELGKEYRTVSQSKDYIIFDLHTKP